MPQVTTCCACGQDDNDDASAVNGGGWRVIETGKIDAGTDTLT